MLMTRSNEQLI